MGNVYSRSFEFACIVTPMLLGMLSKAILAINYSAGADRLLDGSSSSIYICFRIDLPSSRSRHSDHIGLQPSWRS